jgi:hypothetical protein
MERLAHRLADAVAATGDNHDFAGHLHGPSPSEFFYVKTIRSRIAV